MGVVYEAEPFLVDGADVRVVQGQRAHALLDEMEMAPSRASRASSSGRNFRTTWRPKRNSLLDDCSSENRFEDVSRRPFPARMVGAETGNNYAGMNRRFLRCAHSTST
jgi:hypothetical protein